MHIGLVHIDDWVGNDRCVVLLFLYQLLVFSYGIGIILIFTHSYLLPTPKSSGGKNTIYKVSFNINWWFIYRCCRNIGGKCEILHELLSSWTSKRTMHFLHHHHAPCTNWCISHNNGKPSASYFWWGSAFDVLMFVNVIHIFQLIKVKVSAQYTFINEEQSKYRNTPASSLFNGELNSQSLFTEF